MVLANPPSLVVSFVGAFDFFGLARPPCSGVRKSIWTSVPRPSPLPLRSGSPRFLAVELQAQAIVRERRDRVVPKVAIGPFLSFQRQHQFGR